MRPFCLVDSLQSYLVSEQRNLMLAGRSSKSKRRSGMVARRKSPHNCSPDADQCQSGDHQMSLKIMETNHDLKRSRQESESSIMGKRRLHRDRRFHATVRRSGCRVPRRNAAAARVGPGLRRRHHSTPASSSGRRCNGSRYSQEPCEAGNKRAAEAGLNRLKFHEGDACNLEGVDDDSFDIDSLRVRRDVCT